MHSVLCFGHSHDAKLILYLSCEAYVEMEKNCINIYVFNAGETKCNRFT